MLYLHDEAMYYVINHGYLNPIQLWPHTYIILLGFFPAFQRQHNRLCCDPELLHRPGSPADGVPLGKGRRPGVFLNHPDSEAVQTHPPLVGAQDPHPDFQGVRQRAHAACILPRSGNRHLCVSSLLRREDTGEKNRCEQRRGLVPVCVTFMTSLLLQWILGE